MVSSLKLSDTNLRQITEIITHICLSGEFASLKKELEEIYREAGELDFETLAFHDALYALLHQIEEYTSKKEYI